MAQHLLDIRAFLERLGRRERRLLVGHSLLHGLAALLASLVAAGLMLSLGAERATVIGFVGTLGGVLLYLALAWPLLPRWRASGDRRRQARLVEGLQPELRSRLLTAVDCGEGGQQSVSQALLARATARARDLALAVPPSRVHPPWPLLRAGAVAAAAVLASLVAGLVLPVGPIDAMASLLTGDSVAHRLADDDLVTPDERALVGDIVFHYVYPDYTGLEPREVPNTDGTIHAPPGTVVYITARTAEPFEAAAIQVDGQTATEARLAHGRDLAASLVVSGDGLWRFLLFSGRTAMRSPDYTIMAEADAPPVVATEDPTPMAVLDQPLGIRWQVSDDYGISKVMLEVEQGGVTRQFVLREPQDGPLQLQGQISHTPRELGLRAGQAATLRVVAIDNNRLDNGNRGASRDMEVTVLGPQGQGERLTRYHRELRDAMVLALADFLVDEQPPGETAKAMAVWAEDARLRLVPIQELVEAQWGEASPSGVDGSTVSAVMEAGGRLLRFTQTAFDPAGAAELGEGDLSTWAGLHAEEVEALEKGIWILDKMLRSVAMQQVAEQAQELAQEARELRELADSDADAAQLLARLDQLERQMRKLAEATSKLAEGQLKDFLNSRNAEMKGMLDAIREAIAQGRLEDAQRMLDQMARQLEEMANGINDQLRAEGEGDDKLGEALKKLQQDLSQLEKDQQALADELSQARDKEGGQLQQMMQLWRRLDELSAQLIVQTRSAVARPGVGQGWRSGTQAALERVDGSAVTLEMLIYSRDETEALYAHGQTTSLQQTAARLTEREKTRARPADQQLSGDVDGAIADLNRASEILAEMGKILEKLNQAEETNVSEQLRNRARQLADEQRGLSQRQEQLGDELKKAEQALPTGDGKATQAMEQAGEGMQRAEQALGKGEPMSAEGNQRQAAGRLAEARQHLERQMQEAAQMQQGIGQMQGEQGGGQDEPGDGEQQAMMHQQVEIPAPESFRTPEDYRRGLQQGMEEDVPEEFRDLKKRYYEELMRQ